MSERSDLVKYFFTKTPVINQTKTLNRLLPRKAPIFM